MKRAWMALFTSTAMVMAGTAATLVPTEAEAKRFGGARSQGLQRSLPTQSTPAKPAPTTPAQPGAPTNSAAAAPVAGGAAAAATAGKRSWMGPIAGLAAGLGIAALMSHLGLGEAFGNVLMLALLAVAAIFLVRFLMRRLSPPGTGAGLSNRGLQPVAAGGVGAMPAWDRAPSAGSPNAPMQRQALAEASTVEPAPMGESPMPAASGAVPADFDAAGFERIAKMIFIRMQTANDSGDLNDLRHFTTPEMFAAVRLELQERGEATQTTDVLKVDAEVLEVAEEDDRQVVSVRFHGLVREERDAVATDFDEVWHLVKPNDDSRPWAIAGIQQR